MTFLVHLSEIHTHYTPIKEIALDLMQYLLLKTTNGPRAEGKIDIYIFLHVLFEVPLPVPNLPPGGTSVHFSFPS